MTHAPPSDEFRRRTVQLRYRLWCALLTGVLLCSGGGCRFVQRRTLSADRPVRHSVGNRHFVIQSNTPIAEDSPLVAELESLRLHITDLLRLPPQRDPVIVYLFDDEATYRRYMHATWPNLPPRRAYFVGSSRELSVYSYRGPRVREDLRHEFTHGLLHASLATVPLWLDEGLAEYFEVEADQSGQVHQSHLALLQQRRAQGWSPALHDLEQLEDFQAMTQQHYAEAWSWVHFLLSDSTQTRTVLIDYLRELRSVEDAPPLLPRLQELLPHYHNNLVAHLTEMERQPPVRQAGWSPGY